MSALAEWLAADKHDKRRKMSRVMKRADCSYDTVFRVKKGGKVGLAIAIRLSAATDGEVPIAALTDDPVPEALLPAAAPLPETKDSSDSAKSALVDDCDDCDDDDSGEADDVPPEDVQNAGSSPRSAA
jgi:hypothetical protein